MTRRAFTAILLLSNITFSLGYSDFIFDILLTYENTGLVSELSCSYKESMYFLKKVNKQRKLARVINIDEQSPEFDALHNNQLFIMNLDCKNSLKILDAVNQKNLFMFPFKWIFSHQEPLEEILQYFKTINVMVDSDINLLELNENDTATWRKIYRLKHNIKIETIGYWDKKSGLTESGIEKNVLQRRNDLERIILNTCIVITNNDSLNHLTDKRDKHIDSITKVNYVLVEHLSNIVNARLNYSVEPTWGYKVNNQWTGMLGELSRKEAEIGGTPLFFTEDRVSVIDYIAMTTKTKSYFVFREPKLSYVTNVFILPFNKQVWFSTIALVILTAIFLYYILNWEVIKQQRYLKQLSSGANERYTVVDVALISFGAMCQQASHSVPTSIAGRISTILLFVSLMFLYTSYSANIVALLQSSSSSIQSLQDLLKSRLEVGVDDTVFNRFYFPNAREATRKAIYHQKVAPPGQKAHFLKLREGVKRIREGLFAFHMEAGVGYKLIGEIFQESEKCGLQEISFLEVVDPWLAVQKNSPYKKLLKIGKIQESGIQSREVGLIYTKKPICVSRGSSFISVGLVDCYPAAVVLAGGIIASLLVWMIEMVLSDRSPLAVYFKQLKELKQEVNRKLMANHHNGFTF